MKYARVANVLLRIFFLGTCCVVLSGCNIISSNVNSPEDILSAVYGDYLYVDQNGSCFSLCWPDNTEFGLCNLDMTAKHANIDSKCFLLSSDKDEYSVGETPVLTLFAKTDGEFCWEYNIEQQIDGKWYWLNSLSGWPATLCEIQAGDTLQIEVNPICGGLDDDRYQLEAGVYRIVVPMRINNVDDNDDQREIVYVSCKIAIK